MGEYSFKLLLILCLFFTFLKAETSDKSSFFVEFYDANSSSIFIKKYDFSIKKCYTKTLCLVQGSYISEEIFSKIQKEVNVKTFRKNHYRKIELR